MAEGQSLGARLKAIFSEFDSNKEHVIPREKLTQVLKGLDASWTEAELDTLFEIADKDGNGVIDYNEFVDFVCYIDEDPDGMTMSETKATEEVMKAAKSVYETLAEIEPEALEFINSQGYQDMAKAKFTEVDLNGNGVLEGAELHQCVMDFLTETDAEEFKSTNAVRAMKRLTKDSVDKLILAFDENKNGSIELAEFAEFSKFCFATCMAEAAACGDDAADLVLDAGVDGAEIAAEIVAPLQAGVAGTEAEYTGPAPFMHEYHMKVLKNVEAMMSKPMEYHLELLHNPEAMEQQKKENEFLVEELKVLIKKTFDKHDSRKDNVLDKEEAALFFQHFADEQELMAKAISQLAVCTMFTQQISMIAGMLDHGEVDDFKAAMKEGVDQALKEINTKVAEMSAGYKQNKAERDAAAFALTDTNGDGTLNLDEAIAVLTPGDPKNTAFIAALGFQL